MSTSAAGHLSPAFPERAAWGTAAKLRAWQEDALAAYLERGERDFLAVATPGAGKTTYALRIATELLDRGVVRAVTVVAPTEHLKTQWADAAARVGIHLNPAFSNSSGLQSHEYDGVALTYAQVASKPQLHRRRTEDMPDARHPRRDPPRRRRAVVGRRHPGGLRRRRPGACRSPARRSAPTPTRSRSCATRWARTASCAPRPTTPTGTPPRCATGSCDRCSSSPTAARCAGAPRPVTRSPPGSASRSPRTRPPRPGAPRSTPRASGCPRCSRPPTSGSARCAATCRMPVGWSSPRTGPRPAPTRGSCASITGEDADRRAVRRRRGERRDRAVRRRHLALDGRRADGVRGRRRAAAVRRASTPRRPRPRCSSPRPSAGSCGPGAAARRPRCSCRRCRSSSRTPRRWRRSATTPWTGRQPTRTRRRCGPRRRVCSRRRTAPSRQSGPRRERVRGAGVRRPLRPRALRRPAVRAARRRRVAGGAGLPRAARACSSPSRWRRCCTSARRSSPGRRRRAAGSPAPASGPSPVSAHRALASQRKELNKLVAAYSSKTGTPHASIHLELRRACGGPELAAATSEQVRERVDRIRRWFVGRR